MVAWQFVINITYVYFFADNVKHSMLITKTIQSSN